MLILTRRLDEEIMIDDDIKISILGIQGNQVRIGINAPRERSVHRKEIYDRIKQTVALNTTEASMDASSTDADEIQAIIDDSKADLKETKITVRKFIPTRSVSNKADLSEEKIPLAA